RLEEVAVGGTDMRLRGGAAATAQHHLAGHELAVVFAEAARQWAESGVGPVGAGGPFPDVAEQLRRALVRAAGSGRMQVIAFQELAIRRSPFCRYFPFRFTGQAGLGPARVGVGFVEADVADRCLELQLAEPAQRHLVPGVIPAL